MSISKKKATLLFSYIAAAFLVLGGFLLQSRHDTAAFKYQTEVKYQHSFSELVSGVAEIDSALQKSLYATSPSLISSTCTDAFGKAMMAKMSLGELPFAEYKLEETSSFISKVGDYTYLLSKNAAAGAAYTEEQYNNLVTLSQVASLLSQNLLALQSDINDGVITFSELNNSKNQMGKSEEKIIPSSLGESFQLIESEFPEIPSLIYDGPFSQHLIGRSPKMLEGKSVMAEDLALKVVAEFTGLKANIFELYSECEGPIPSYCYSAAVDGGELSVEISQAGGMVVNMINSREIPAAELSADEAIAAAAAFLEERGFTSMKESYWTLNGNAMIINFAYQQDGVICYTDLIKVSVALDNGRIVGFESKGYLMNHTEREIPAAAVSAETALAQVAPALTVLSHELAIIPSAGENEIFCHEFKCQNGDEKHYIVYVNALTGNQEKVLLLLEDETGTLAM